MNHLRFLRIDLKYEEVYEKIKNMDTFGVALTFWKRWSAIFVRKSLEL
jgi:hypothetical protein